MLFKAVSAGLVGVVFMILAFAQGLMGSSRVLQSGSVCLNELLPKPVCSDQMAGTDKLASYGEFIELYNFGVTPVDLSGWTLQVSPGGSLVIASGTQIAAGDYWVSSGLALPDRGATVRLLDQDGVSVDQFAYSSPSCGLSIGRYPDGGSWWRSDLLPSPGGANRAAPSPSPEQTNTPTCTRTATPTRTSVPTRTRTPTKTVAPYGTPRPSATVCPTRDPNLSVCISEFLPAPGSLIDWDGDGEANYRDEWIELYNASAVDLDLCGWKLDDRANSGARPYVFPAGSMLSAGQYRAYYLRDTGIALNNSGGDDVRLLAPDGTVVDSVSYEQTAYDVSYSRMDGCRGEWTTALPPSPGQPNITPTPTIVQGTLYLPLIQRPRS